MIDKPIRSIGILMDGNRRWARERGLPAFEGHRAGYEKIRDVLNWCRDIDVKHLIVFGFSTENWNRTPDEVRYLLELIHNQLERNIDEFKAENGRVRIVGQRERFSKETQEIFARAESETKDGAYTLWLAVSYGGRAEILHAVNELLAEGRKHVSEEEFIRKLWTAGMPDPDLIIRTSGEQRLSGFLPWQGVYSELFFTKTYWPAFSREEFDAILAEYARRERRHGR